MTTTDPDFDPTLKNDDGSLTHGIKVFDLRTMQYETLTPRSPHAAVKYLGVHLTMEGYFRAHTAYLDKEVNKILDALYNCTWGYHLVAIMARSKLQGLLGYSFHSVPVRPGAVANWYSGVQRVLKKHIRGVTAADPNQLTASQSVGGWGALNIQALQGSIAVGHMLKSLNYEFLSSTPSIESDLTRLSLLGRIHRRSDPS